MPSASKDCEALVVGGGPVGLALGCELLRHGVPCRVIESKTEREVWSKAAGIQPRTLEVFRHMGIADRIVDSGHRVFAASMYADGKLLTRLELDVPGTPFPFMLGLSQKRTEEILEEQFESLGGTLERGIELTGFEQNELEVSATLSRDGTTETVTVPWLFGCDGAHSFVRKHLDLPFEGSTFEQELIHADLHADLPPGADPNEGHMYISEHGACGFLPLFGENRYRLIVIAPEPELCEPTLENFRKHLERRAPGVPIEISDPDWMIGFRFHSRVVPQYRVNRVFLAGDAAHIHSPAGAQGMNLGIQDAFNLAWKVGLVQRGAAHASLLDSYHAERHPIGHMIVNTTDAGTRRAIRMVTLRNPIATAIRNQLIKLIVGSGFIMERVMSGVGGLNVGYPDSPIVGQYHASVWTANVTQDDRSEVPSLREWMRFEQGPAAGTRVPEIEMPNHEGTLFDLLTGTKHTLLLFDGAAATDAGYETLSTIARHAQDRHGLMMDIHVIAPHAEQPAKLDWQGSYIADPDLELHAHFGARSESLYLIRPDGYVGYRSQPAHAERLEEYLHSVFV